jgi:hypothetical protein
MTSDKELSNWERAGNIINIPSYLPVAEMGILIKIEASRRKFNVANKKDTNERERAN